ncbi:MAG TPA: nucleoside monophosphate kinase [Bryobacteraceae bacterium]|nr:nucleoside monophosphate kinase [Bryobacteraceae bacterium]
MIILLFGPPGCGKGTQAEFLVEKLHIPAVSTGAMFRAESQSGTPLGRHIRDLLARGALIGDEIVNPLVARRIAAPDCARGFLLDGYPRTVAQAVYFAELLRGRGLPEPRIIHLDVPVEILVERLAARRQCPACHRIYNLLSHPPSYDGVCDHDGAVLIAREDDDHHVIRERLHAYARQTGPVLDWYGPSRVIRVDGSPEPQAVAAAIHEALRRPLVRTSVN